jgi:tyrosyl-tRNA synthetase
MPNVYDTLKARGSIGYDPTADSLTTGHLMTLMIHAHMQQAGHRFITVMGTGTGMIGDPTERNDMRRVMPPEEVAHNIACFKEQFSRFINYDTGSAFMEENGWLLELNLVDFMRDYGVFFNVNRMLAAECYKNRLQEGLTAFEMTYMLMQAYDFLELYRRYGCRLQLGGSEQWGNIIAGIDLVRKKENVQVYGLTNVLLTAADGGKMGKSVGNAVWLDAKKTTPYEFYQHWRNTADSQTVQHLKLFTFLTLESISEMAQWQGAEINRAKEILAYEVTKIVHGEEEAQKAQNAAKKLFKAGAPDAEGDAGDIPTTRIPRTDAEGGINVVVLLEKCGLIKSRSEARQLISQGGIKINDVKITTHEHTVTEDEVLIQKGKKIFHRGKLV